MAKYYSNFHFYFYLLNFFLHLQVDKTNEIARTYSSIDELTNSLKNQTFEVIYSPSSFVQQTATDDLFPLPLLFSIKIQCTPENQLEILNKLERYKDNYLEQESFKILLSMPGSVYILCAGNNLPVITQLEIGRSTFICESIDVIDEIDNEDSNGDLMSVLCKTGNKGSITVDQHVVNVAVKYLKKTCSGTNKKNLPCGNRVRETMSKCRWHIESTEK
jgi:hypothetical protein